MATEEKNDNELEKIGDRQCCECQDCDYREECDCKTGEGETEDCGCCDDGGAYIGEMECIDLSSVCPVKLEHPLLTTNYTEIFHEEDPQFGAPHSFLVVPKEIQDKKENEITGYAGYVHFQEGPIKEYGVNGIANEDALVMVLVRLEGFQKTQFACEENAQAIEHIEAALKVLRERTNKRATRNVEGTSQV